MSSDSTDHHQNSDRPSLAVEAVMDGLWDWDLKHNTVYFSPQWQKMLGIDEIINNSASPQEWLRRVHPEDLEQLEIKIEAHFQGKTPYFEAEYRIYSEKGYYLWVWARGHIIKGEDDQPQRFIGLQTDITEKKMREEQYLHDAFHDPLTGLANRALFMDRLNQALLSRLPFAVMYMDLDQFKAINDRFGHQVGDEFLTMIAQRLVKCSRGGDTTARLGGDEFALLVSNISKLSEVTSIARRVIREVSLPFILEGRKLSAHLSIGVALGISPHYKTGEEILRDADIALYRAKKEQGLSIFDEKMRKDRALHFELEVDLRNAVENNEITVYYQPIFDTQTNEVVGVKSLLRWIHKKYGVLTPGDFLHLVEDKNLILPLEKCAIRKACEGFQKLNEVNQNKSLFMSLNISQEYLKEPSLINELENIIKNYNLRSSDLALEIKERYVMENQEALDIALKNIKDAGLKLVFDDFGVKFTSMASLYKYGFGFGFLKIDHSLIQKMLTDEVSRGVVKLIIQIAKDLKLKVIAEGVETKKSLDLLHQYKCSYVQGFLFAKPMPLEIVLPFIMHQLK